MFFDTFLYRVESMSSGLNINIIMHSCSFGLTHLGRTRHIPAELIGNWNIAMY